MSEFFGEHFDTPKRLNMRAFTRFGTLAQRGLDSADMEAVAAIDALITQCVEPADLQRFEDVCDRERPSFEELLEFMMGVVSEVTQRPTERASDSSDGPQPMSDSSEDDSSSRVIRRLVDEGRPSIAYMVRQRSALAERAALSASA